MDEESPKTVVNYGPLLLRSIWSLFAFATIFAGLRVAAKVTTRRPLQWDDHFLSASWVCLIVSVALLTKGVDYGIGLHFEDMTLEYIPIVAEYSFAAGFATILGIAWSKTSFGLTILRVLTGWMRWLTIFIIVSMNLVMLANAIMLYAQCTPVRRLFDELVEGTCWPKTIHEHYQTFCAVYSGLGDIVLALLPWKIVWKAKLIKREKIGVIVAMSLGVFSGIMSFLKIISLGEISDVRATTVDLKIFGIAELSITIIAVSIPILRVFIQNGHRSYFPKSSADHRSKLSQQSASLHSRNQESQSDIPLKKIRMTRTVEVHHGPGRKGYYQV